MSAGSYRELFAVPGVRRVLATQAIGPLASNAWALVLILLVLDKFDSPALAGLTVLLTDFGIIFVPFAGAFLDSYGHKRLIIIDYVASAIGIAIVAALAATDSLSRLTLLALVSLVGITCQFSVLGLRTALPLTVSAHLWDRANALTFTMRAVARVIAPLMVACLASFFSPSVAALCTALIYVGAMFIMWGYKEPAPQNAGSGSVMGEAIEGVRYTFTTPMLRNIAIFCLIASVPWGALYGAIPAFVTRAQHHSTLFLGLAYAFFAVVDIVVGVTFGRVNTERREWLVLTGATAACGAGLLIISMGSVPAILIGIAFIGASETPFDQVAYGIRHRWANAEMMGRVMSIAIAITFGGFASGVALTGLISDTSARLALAASGAALLAASAMPVMLLRKHSVELPDDPHEVTR